MSAEDNRTARVKALQQRLETLELDKSELLIELTQLKQSQLGSQANRYLSTVIETTHPDADLCLSQAIRVAANDQRISARLI